MKTANFISTMRYAEHVVADAADRARCEGVARMVATEQAGEMNGELSWIAHVWGFDSTGDPPGYQPYHWMRTDFSVVIPDQPAEPSSELE